MSKLSLKEIKEELMFAFDDLVDFAEAVKENNAEDGEKYWNDAITTLGDLILDLDLEEE